MIENINDITLQGGLFTTQTTLHNILERPMNIVLGVNGSGKTTISRHFINNKESLYHGLVHIFNDDYIQRNLSVKEDGVHTIAMFGERQIEDNNSKQELENQLGQTNLDLEKIPDERHLAQEQQATTYNDILAALNNKKGGYAMRQVTSFGLKTLLDRFVVKDAESILYYAKSYQNDFHSLSSTLDEINPIISALAPIGEKEGKKQFLTLPTENLQAALASANALLQRTIPQPNLSQRDDFMIRLATSAMDAHYISDAQDRFIKHQEKRCPLCCQPLTDEYIDALKQRISAILNKETEQFTSMIDQCISSLIVPQSNWTHMSKYCKPEVEQLDMTLTKMTDAIDRAKNILQKKKSSLYQPLAPLPDDIAKAVNEYQQASKALTEALDKYNNDLQHANSLREDFNRLNIKAAYLENKSLFDSWYQITQKLKDLNEREKQLISDRSKYTEQLQSLDASKPDMTLAMKFINRCLSLVFFDDMHLSLKEENNGYYSIKVRGEDVKPNDLSLGEKNVLAMAYFFAELFANQRDSEKYQQEMLLIIDDPISSFDDCNRMGMLTMLGDQLDSVLMGNKHSKVLIMTHDSRTAEDLSRIWARMRYRVYNNTDKVRQEEYSYIYWKLANRRLREVDDRKYSDYEQLLRDIYDFAISNREEDITDGELMSIGNKIRRVMETYTTFNYKKGLECVLENSRFTKGLSERAKVFYTKFPTALMLNRESHEANSTTDNIYSYEDKRLMARAALFYLYKDGGFHLTSYLRDYKDQLRNMFGSFGNYIDNAIFE